MDDAGSPRNGLFRQNLRSAGWRNFLARDRKRKTQWSGLKAVLGIFAIAQRYICSRRIEAPFFSNATSFRTPSGLSLR
jgi:hypothetical protein